MHQSILENGGDHHRRKVTSPASAATAASRELRNSKRGAYGSSRATSSAPAPMNPSQATTPTVALQPATHGQMASASRMAPASCSARRTFGAASLPHTWPWWRSIASERLAMPAYDRPSAHRMVLIMTVLPY